MLRPDLLRIGFCFALLALAGQLAWGATVPDPALAQLSLGVICHSGEAGSAPTAPSHRALDCALCPLCAAIAMPPPALAKPPSLTLLGVVVIARAVVLPSTVASPATILTAAQPRAPPALA